MRVVVLLLLVSCGRIGFGERGPGDSGITGGVIDAPDGAMLAVDVAPLDASFPSGLVSWFPLDDASAGMVADVVSGFGGTCGPASACPSMTPGHRGTAFLFDGDDCIAVPNMGQFGQAQFTVSVWLRQDVSDLCSVVAKPADSVSPTADTWQIETTTVNQINFVSTHGSMSNDRISTAAGALVLGTWQHVALTYDGAMKHLLVNGLVIAVGNMATPLTYTTQDMFIGCDVNSGAPSMRFTGAIDEVQLYNRALTQTEIQMLVAM